MCQGWLEQKYFNILQTLNLKFHVNNNPWLVVNGEWRAHVPGPYPGQFLEGLVFNKKVQS